ncbi:hypothetical protein [Enterovirga sp.]|uniref:hypothetical protein n=1 Tax=Enterovirga sp. TaxID=2026350 RepID=UPI002605F655|nr:hypothetical protein [Enterovirga sp.]
MALANRSVSVAAVLSLIEFFDEADNEDVWDDRLLAVAAEERSLEVWALLAPAKVIEARPQTTATENLRMEVSPLNRAAPAL